MITLSYYSDTELDIVASIPEQWREYVTQEQETAMWRVDIQVQPDDSSYRYRQLMQKPQLVLKFSLPFYFEFPVGTSCVFQNQKFMLTRAQDIKKQGTRKIEYTMTLGTQEDFFGMWKLRNIVDAVEDGEDAPKDNRLKFSLCAKPYEFADLIIRNLNKKDTSITWERGECIEASEKTVEFNHTYIDAGLTDICNAFNTEYEIEYFGTTRAKLHLRRVEYFKTSPVPLSYGCGNGFIPGVGRTSEADGLPVKRMCTQGSDRNIDRSTYGSPELLLPKSQTIRFDGTHFEDEDGFNADIARTYASDANGEYVERTDVVSKATKEDSIDCSEIYPSRVGEVTKVEVPDEENNFYDIIDTTIPANLNFNNYILEGETMTIIFQDGMLSGKEFDVKYKHEQRRFEIVPQEIDGVVMPNKTWCPKEQQKYAVFGIQLPDEYICNNADKSGGSWDMMRAAVRALYECEDQRFTFTGSLQALWAKRHWVDVGGKLIVGGHVLFTDTQFAQDGVLIRIVGIKDYLTQPYSPTIELSNSVSGGSSVSSQLRQITNTEVIIEETKKTAIQFTKRRFRDALETIGMLEDARIGEFTGSISPVAVQAMSLLVGDESLQFVFAYEIITENEDGTTTTKYQTTKSCVGYDNDKKQLSAHMTSGGMNVVLRHMTLGQSNAMMTKTRRDSSGYLTWKMHSFTSAVLDDPTRSYYFYAKVSSTDTDEVGEFVLSEKAIEMESVAGYYHLLVGILNDELEGTRSFVTLYGFTEILPGRITTDLLISNDGKTYFDLEKGEIGGVIKFLSDSGYITIIEGGKIKTELIDVSQLIARSLIVGDENGKHVRIEPDETTGEGSIRIFDENGSECAVFEGKSYDGIDKLYDGSSGGDCTILTRDRTTLGCSTGVTLGRGETSHAYSNIEECISRYVPLSEVWHTGTPTEVSIKRGNMRAYAYSAGFTHEVTKTNGKYDELQPMPNSSASASLYVRIDTYDDEEMTNRIHSVYVAGVSVTASATARVPTIVNDGIQDTVDKDNIGNQSPNIGTTTTTYIYPSDSKDTGSVDISGKSVRVPAGYHRLVLWIYCDSYLKGSNSYVKWGGVISTGSDIVAEWISDFYVSRYFSNGFCLGTRNDNYILAYKDGDKGMHFIMENENYGFDFSKSGIITRAKKGTEWMPIPLLIFKGAYKYDSSVSTDTARYVLNTSEGIRSFIKKNGSATYPSTYRSSKGLVTLTFPDEWKTALSDIGVSNLLIQVNAQHKVIDARVYDITTTSFKVGMSDDASLNDGNFSITIYYLPS